MSSFQFFVPLAEGEQRISTANKGPHDLGAIGVTPDGRQFRYVKNGASAMVAGKLYQGKVPGSNYDELAVPTATAAGSTTLDVTNGATAITKDQFKGGYLGIEDDVGEGYNYLIAGNTADAAGSQTVTITLADPRGLKAAVTTATTVGLYEHNCDSVIVHPSPPTTDLVGVATHAMPASYYGWVQHKGLCQVLIDGTVTIGKSVMASDGVDGAVEAFALTEGTPNAEITGAIGTVREVAATTEYGLVNLNIP